MIGRYALGKGFAYASVDRDGSGGGRAGLGLTTQFTESRARRELTRRGVAKPLRTYLVGLVGGRWHRADGRRSDAGAVRRRADHRRRRGRSRDASRSADADGGAVAADRSARAFRHVADKDPKLAAYAEANGTPIEARRLWPYTGASAVAAAARPPGNAENSTAKLTIPTIEVVGTWDDLVIRELRAYRRARRAKGPASPLPGRGRLAHVGR